jgi:hypothetical protein
MYAWFNDDYPPSYRISRSSFAKSRENCKRGITRWSDEGIAIATGLKRARQYFADQQKETK